MEHKAKSKIRLKYSGLVAFVSKILSLATGLAFALMIARSTTDQEYGIFGNISDIQGYFTILAGIIPFWTTRFVAREHSGSAKTGLIANVIVSIMLAIVYLVSLPFILLVLRIPSAYAIVYAIISIQILELYTLFALQAILHAKQPQAIGYGFLVYETCKVILGFFLILHFQLGLLGIVFSMIIAYSIQIMLFFKVTIKELGGSFKWAYLKEWLKASPINLYGVVGTIIPSFPLILLFMFSETARGYYLVAATIAAIIGHSIYLALGLYPKLLSKTNVADVSTSLKMVLMLAIPMTVGAIMLSDSYIIIQREDLANGSIVLPFLAISSLSASLYWVFDTIVMGTEKIDEKAKIPFRQLLKTRLFQIYTLPYIASAMVIFATFFVLSPNVAKTPLEATLYVAIITMIAYVGMLLCKYMISYKCLAFKFPWKSFAKYAIASAVMGILLFVIPHPTKLLLTLLVTGFGGITYFTILATIDKETRRAIRLIINEAKLKLSIIAPRTLTRNQKQK